MKWIPFIFIMFMVVMGCDRDGDKKQILTPTSWGDEKSDNLTTHWAKLKKERSDGSTDNVKR